VNTLGTDTERMDHVESWQYASVIGMLIYVASNTCPNIAYGVHQCAQFTHYAKKHHDAVKQICQYPHGTKHCMLVAVVP